MLFFQIRLKKYFLLLNFKFALDEYDQVPYFGNYEENDMECRNIVIGTDFFCTI